MVQRYKFLNKIYIYTIYLLKILDTSMLISIFHGLNFTDFQPKDYNFATIY